MDDLPDEIAWNILEYCDQMFLLSSKRVSHKWKTLINDNFKPEACDIYKKRVIKHIVKENRILDFTYNIEEVIKNMDHNPLPYPPKLFYYSLKYNDNLFLSICYYYNKYEKTFHEILYSFREKNELSDCTYCDVVEKLIECGEYDDLHTILEKYKSDLSGEVCYIDINFNIDGISYLKDINKKRVLDIIYEDSYVKQINDGVKFMSKIKKHSFIYKSIDDDDRFSLKILLEDKGHMIIDKFIKRAEGNKDIYRYLIHLMIKQQDLKYKEEHDRYLEMLQNI